MAAKKKGALADFRGERVVKETASKVSYHFVDTEKKVDQLSREVFKTKDLEIHYPIGYDGGPKYKKAGKFVFTGFGGNLPIGVQKSANFGLGFTNVMKSFIDYIEEKLDIAEIHFRKDGLSSIDKKGKILTLVEKDLRAIYNAVKNLLDRQKLDRVSLAEMRLHKLFPDEVKRSRDKYVGNSIASALSSWEQSMSEFSEADKEAVKDLFDKLAVTGKFFSSESLLKTKEAIDATYIDDVILKYESLIDAKSETPTLEKKWQKFLKENSWIFSYIFSFPIILLDDEAYVGGKNLSNKNGKVTDFSVKNDLTDNVAFIEIKTHKTELLVKGKAYRGVDVFAISSELTGAISQVLSQRDNFQKHFSVHKMNSDEAFESFNSKCVVVMGSLSDLNKKQLGSFELFRSNSKDVEILTFDELLGRFKNLKQLMEGRANN